MASAYFLFLCQVCLLDLLPPQHFPCPHLFIESNLCLFFFFFSFSLFFLIFFFPPENPLSCSFPEPRLALGQQPSLALDTHFRAVLLSSGGASGPAGVVSSLFFLVSPSRALQLSLSPVCFSCHCNVLSNNTYHFSMSHSALLRQPHGDWHSNTKKLHLTSKGKRCFPK